MFFRKQCVSGEHKNQVQSCFCYLRNISKVRPILKDTILSALMSSFQEYCNSAPYICDINASKSSLSKVCVDYCWSDCFVVAPAVS